MKDSIINLLLFPSGVFAIFFALILVSLERIVVARLQGRVGPPIYQNIIDIVKLFNKENLIPKSSFKLSFVISPLLGLAGMLFALYILPISGVYEGAKYNNDFIILVYVMALPIFAYVIGGSSSNSTYSAVSVSRVITLMFCYELVLFIVLASVSLTVGNGEFVFSLRKIIAYQQIHNSLMYDIKLLPALIAFIIFALAALDIPPFHITKNSADIMDGYLMEYSGKLLGVFELSKALKLLVIIILFQLLFWSGFSSDSVLLNFLIFTVKSVVILVFFAFIHAILPSFRIDQAFKFLIFVPIPLALITLALVILSVKGLI